MSDHQPIGVLDSGLGGLTLVKELIRLMPHERWIYLGDTARFPYGSRSSEAIHDFALQNVRYLLSRDIKLLAIACNTISAVALDQVRKYAGDLPVIGAVLPGAKAAVLQTAEKKIGVIGTKAAIDSGAYAKAIRRLDSKIKVYARASPLLVPLVEEGHFDTDIIRLAAQRYLYELVDIGIDCLILGCTHYQLLMEVIQSTVGTRIQVVDSQSWQARETMEILTALDACAFRTTPGLNESAVYVTDRPPNSEEMALKFLGQKPPAIEQLSLDKSMEQ